MKLRLRPNHSAWRRRKRAPRAWKVDSVSAGAAVRARLQRAAHARAEVHAHEHGPGCGHPAVVHDDHVDYLHDGHRHAPHEGHYDEHGEHESSGAEAR